MSHEQLIESMKSVFSKAPKLDSTTALIFQREAYLMAFGITTDAELDRRKLGLVAMYDSEDPIAGSRYLEHLKKFRELQVHATYGIDFESFLEMPRWRVDAMYAEAEVAVKERIASAAGGISDAERAIREMGPHLPKK